MQAAATADPAKRSRASVSRESATAAADLDESQPPALVSQLQARFDALAVTDAQQHSEQQSAANDRAGQDVRPLLVLEHEPTLLVLDGELQAMPWESLSSLKHLRSATHHLLETWLACQSMICKGT